MNLGSVEDAPGHSHDVAVQLARRGAPPNLPVGTAMGLVQPVGIVCLQRDGGRGRQHGQQPLQIGRRAEELQIGLLEHESASGPPAEGLILRRHPVDARLGVDGQKSAVIDSGQGLQKPARSRLPLQTLAPWQPRHVPAHEALKDIKHLVLTRHLAPHTPPFGLGAKVPGHDRMVAVQHPALAPTRAGASTHNLRRCLQHEFAPAAAAHQALGLLGRVPRPAAMAAHQVHLLRPVLRHLIHLRGVMDQPPSSFSFSLSPRARAMTRLECMR